MCGSVKTAADDGLEDQIARNAQNSGIHKTVNIYHDNKYVLKNTCEMKRFVLTQAPPVVKQNYAGHVATLAHAYSDSLCYLCG